MKHAAKLNAKLAWLQKNVGKDILKIKFKKIRVGVFDSWDYQVIANAMWNAGLFASPRDRKIVSLLKKYQGIVVRERMK